MYPSGVFSSLFIKRLLRPEQADELYAPEAKALVGPTLASSGQPVEAFRNFHDALTFEQFDRLPEYHCMRLDRMTMACGVEARVPFLDHRIVEFAQTIPLDVHFGGKGKALLREAAKPWLPASIILRQKTHFPSLPDQWLSGEGASWAAEILLDPGARTAVWFKRATIDRWIKDHASGARRYGRVLWACIVLEIWLQQEWTA